MMQTMEIKREQYLKQLIDGENNGLIKIVTGIRRCGKSYLLFKLFFRHLIASGVQEDHIIRIALDDIENEPLREPMALYKEVKSRITDDGRHYVLLDEVQLVPRFEEVLNSLLRMENVDTYVTGSNSKFLSSDIVTEFRGRGDEIRVYPLSFSEYCSGTSLPANEAWKDYYTYGGLPLILSLDSPKKKTDYLSNLYKSVYLVDIIERHGIKNRMEFERLANTAASCIGTPTNPTKLSNTFKTEIKSSISPATIDNYLDYMGDAFLLEKAVRFDIKGKKYIKGLAKYYFTDVGIRNAALGMRQLEETHIMENVIFNELRIRGFNVDVGALEQRSVSDDGKWQRNQLEVDFVANYGNLRYYIQSALVIPDDEKRRQETASLLKINDAFRKIIVVRDDINPWTDDNGILTIGLLDFLLKREWVE